MGKKIVIIGGGPAGYEAALEGAALGADITLIEDHKIGGTCLNYGCIPTKTLIEQAAFYKKIRMGSVQGVRVDDVTLDYSMVLEHRDSVIEGLCSGIHTKLKKAKVNYMMGTGMVIDDKHVRVSMNDGVSMTVEAEVIILATGSKAFMPSFEGVDSSQLLTSRELLGLKVLPESITIVGGGVIGMEFGVLLRNFGVRVTILEYEKHLLPSIDSAIGKRLKRIISNNDIQVVTGAKVTGFTDEQDGIITIYQDKMGVHSISSQYALMSIGRIGNFDPLALSELGIEHDERFVQVDENFRTSLNGVYAIGDINGKNLLAHAAYDQARQLMRHLIHGAVIVEKSVPGCVFTSPEISTIGFSEDAAKAMNIAYRSEKTLFSSSGKAQAMGETLGFIKTLADEKGHLIGCHILGPHASDLIHYASIAMAAGMSVGDLNSIIFAHPTLGELFSDNLRQYRI